MPVPDDRLKIKSFSIEGFRSIKRLENFAASDINVMIGTNGAGKSNLIAFFRLLSFALKSPTNFQNHLNQLGRGSGILHLGPKTTQSFAGKIAIETKRGNNEYEFRLALKGREDLIYMHEAVRFTNPSISTSTVPWKDIGVMGAQSALATHSSTNTTVKVIASIFKNIYTYQFHDTSPFAEIRQSWQIADGRYLRESGSNLGSFLYNLKENYNDHYLRLVEYIREVLHTFDDFILLPLGERIELQWLEKNSEYVFTAYQASDGTLRFFALVALLAQPPELLSKIMFVDEPELGLHPAAIEFVAGLIKKASAHSQMFISTQSPDMVSQFEPEDVIVVEKKGHESTFKRLQLAELEGWLEEYSLGQIWAMNIVGGQY